MTRSKGGNKKTIQSVIGPIKKGSAASSSDVESSFLSTIKEAVEGQMQILIKGARIGVPNQTDIPASAGEES